MQQKVILQMTAAVVLVLTAVVVFLHQETPTPMSATMPQDVIRAVAMVEEKGCPVCHSQDGAAGIGPTWQGSWGSLRQFGDGGSAVFDGAYLHESVTNPGAKVVQGFQNLMVPAALSEAEFQQLELLLRYLATPATE